MTVRVSVLVAAALALCAALPAPASAQNLQLTWVDRSGKTIETVGPSGPYRGPDLSPDGKRLAVHRHDESSTPGRPGGGDVIVFASGAAAATPLTGDSADVEHSMPLWSPDGTRIAYGSTRNGKGGLYAKRADGTGREELLFESETSKVPMSWSPDGKYIVYWSPGNVQWVLSLADRKLRQLSPAATSHAQVSPDGKWVAYQLNVGRSEIFVESFPAGSKPVRVSRDGGIFARWARDGKELLFLSEGQMMSAAITANGSTVTAAAPVPLFSHGYVNLFHPGGNYHVFAVSRDGERFLIPRPDPTPSADDPNARTLAMFDRQGSRIGTVGERGLYNFLALSPDRTRLALLKTDQGKGTTDIWVLDVASGKSYSVTSSTRDDNVRSPVWSPDGQQIAYIVAKKGVEAIYRKAANGTGPETLVFTLNGANIVLQEWTGDGRYLTYYAAQLGGNIVFALPLSGEQKPVEIFRSQFPILHPRLSPDNRYIAFRSNESGKDEIWVRRFDASKPSDDKWKISDGGTGPVYWNGDGKAITYLALDRGMMGVNVRADSNFTFDPPKLLFKIPEAFPAGAGIGPAATMSRDGDRFIFAVPRTPPTPAPLPQVTLVNRQGNTIRTVGDAARYTNAQLSPDGSRVLVMKVPETGNIADLLLMDVATGKGTSVANGQLGSFMWSRDGKQIFYVSNRPGGFPVIMRKAADGSGTDEALYQYTPGAPLNIGDITPDGKLLAFESGGVILMLPLGATAGPREATEVIREEYFTFNPRFSADGKSIAYVSTESDRPELWVQPFDSAKATPVGQKRQVTTDGAGGIAYWRPDGRQLYYFKGDLNEALLMVVDVPAAPGSRPTPARFLFRSTGGMSRDGETFVVVKPPS